MELTEAHFQALDPSDSGAFLKWNDATRSIKSLYGKRGLKGKDGARRIAKVVRLPAGTRLFKATQHKEMWTRDLLSAWWSTVEPFQESEYGALELVEVAEENSRLGETVTFRDLIRFISAVSLDWNKLDWYVEIGLRRDVYAFWGQFAPQDSIQKAPPQGTTLTMQHGTLSGWSSYVDYGNGQKVYLPDKLGGFGAWQLYIPNFNKQLIDPSAIINLDATDNAKLKAYLRGRHQR